MNIQEFFETNNKVALGFSGGVDSSYLLYAAKEAGADIGAYYVKSQFQPQFELDDALKLAEHVGAELKVLECDVLSEPKVASNPSDRCYYCKRHIFGAVADRAAKDGYGVLIDGTNASDDAGDRPGTKALGELKVLSPLRDCGLTKDDIRALSKEAGLFTWNKPSYACLATRIPEGEEITDKTLRRIEGAEDVLRMMGFSDFRVRKRGDIGLLQIPECQMVSAVKLNEEIVLGLKPYFKDVVLDLVGRRR
ncbi:ATP-dependent sacrificial sulfur transferase LarE [Aminicella lysinilytica]|uniref:NAD/GMP synthase domain-containing protein n=1 Tax=Aminicella lysinilytica TaxID=433323 RepID=A0A4R6Q6A5_9FIRM|nr:ATP-dependent sacrificial sulfur transferase LarE [Aminicella lysinilytica]TDP57306.1 uncharacterized protein EV211_11330 [Aminicella lysinilytica]